MNELEVTLNKYSRSLKQVFGGTIIMAECPTCGAEVQLAEGTVAGELLSCADCGTELEVLNPETGELGEAPQEEEDWGQ